MNPERHHRRMGVNSLHVQQIDGGAQVREKDHGTWQGIGEICRLSCESMTNHHSVVQCISMNTCAKSLETLEAYRAGLKVFHANSCRVERRRSSPAARAFRHENRGCRVHFQIFQFQTALRTMALARQVQGNGKPQIEFLRQ